MTKYSEHFGDLDLDNMGFGGLSGDAVENHNKARSKTAADGVKIQLACDHCGAPNVMTIDWPEAIIISAGAVPPGWKYELGYIRPQTGCGSCRRLVSPGITPEEAKRWVTAGINARFVDPVKANTLVQQAARGAVR